MSKFTYLPHFIRSCRCLGNEEAHEMDAMAAALEL